MTPVLLLDNRDSFVWNLAQAIQVLGHDVDVVRSDAINAKEVRERAPAAIVISPGPGHPDTAGCSKQVVSELTGEIPILGVCLGHQAIAAALGARIRRAPPCHGKPWPVLHDGSGLYRNLPQPMLSCRYHSLVVDPDSLPQELVADAWNPEGLLMGLHHARHPTFGVQFHPESFRSPHGPTLIHNFLELCA